MFTGIVRAQASVASLEKAEKFMKICLNFPQEECKDLLLGASVAVDGVCLTVTDIQDLLISFDVVAETLERTTLFSLNVGDYVHIERSLRYGDEVGGHFVSGHILDRGKVIYLDKTHDTYTLGVQIPALYFPRLSEKGYVALHGVSLTVCQPRMENSSFMVKLIPETLKRTRFSHCQLGDYLNVELPENC